VGLTPAANRLQLRVEQLDRDLRWAWCSLELLRHLPC
jgi:hypothetical protein